MEDANYKSLRAYMEALEDRVRTLEQRPIAEPLKKKQQLQTFEAAKYLPFTRFDKVLDLRQIERSSVSVDLSGSATTLVMIHSEQPVTLLRAWFLYTEGSSGDAGITLEIGKETDRDYYFTGATEISKSQWYTKQLTLLKADVAPGDTVTFYSPGGKTGAGEVMLILEYKLTLT